MALITVTTAACGSSPSSPPSPTAERSTTRSGAPKATPASVSGSPMPKGDLTGWHQVLADDFTGTALRRVWTTYSGQPGGDPAGWWEPSHVVVEGSQLHLRTYREGGRWVSGGVGAWRGDGLTYGKVEVRMRAPQARGVAYAMLLWPVSNRWPDDGEIDFAEDGGGDRSGTAATVHFGANNQEFTRSVNADFADWQTIGVEWTPSKLVYTLNGRPWATVNSDHVPDTHMVLAMQSQVWGCHIVAYKCPDASTPATSSIDVDWVVAYERAAG